MGCVWIHGVFESCSGLQLELPPDADQLPAWRWCVALVRGKDRYYLAILLMCAHLALARRVPRIHRRPSRQAGIEQITGAAMSSPFPAQDRLLHMSLTPPLPAQDRILNVSPPPRCLLRTAS
jgi:hypothetical protein